MDENYKSEIEDSKMIDRLLVVDNLPIIEGLLEEESQELKRLRKLKGDNKLNFGGKVSLEEFEELSPQIYTEVDDFLKVERNSMPSIRYGGLSEKALNLSTFAGGLFGASLITTSYLLATQNPDIAKSLLALGSISLVVTSGLLSYGFFNPRGSYYNHSSRKINLEKIIRTGLIPTAGHEYTHFIQSTRGLSTKHSIFLEGHARGVQRQLSEHYREKEDNEAFLWDISNLNVEELKTTYRWMCRKLKQQPKESLLQVRTAYNGTKPECHSLGNTLFLIYEAHEGTDIYAQMIEGDFQFA